MPRAKVLPPQPGFIFVPILVIVLAVAAFGTLAYLSLQKPKTEVATSTVNINTGDTALANTNTGATNTRVNVNTSTNTNTTADEMKDWKTYTNTMYHYSIKYPPTWHTSEAQTNASLSPNVPVVTDVNIPQGDCCPGPDIYITQADKITNDPPYTQNRKTIVINGVQATQQEYGGLGNSLETFIPSPNGKYIHIYWEKDLGSTTHTQVLSTLRFTQ